jgi:predicted regulator of Ras-like GTPase activity (Roadblock/LC7/MglB family)
MSAIHELLGDIRRIQGVLGAAVMTTEGMTAASDLDPRFDEDTVAGLTSFLMSTINRSLGELTDSGCVRFTMHTTHGKIVVDDADGANLIVITDQFTKISSIAHEIDDATRRLKRVCRISL